MYSVLPLALAGFIAVAVLTIGSFYLASPARVVGSFGLKLPSPDADTRAWLRLKGIRDVGSGLVVLTLMLMAERHLLGMVLTVYAIIPLGDMLIVLGSGGSKSKAFSIHGLTCAVMLAAGQLLIHAR